MQNLKITSIPCVVSESGETHSLRQQKIAVGRNAVDQVVCLQPGDEITRILDFQAGWHVWRGVRQSLCKLAAGNLRS